MKGEEIVAKLKAKFADAVTVPEGMIDTTVVVPAAKLLEVAKFCRDEKDLKLDLLHCLSGVDTTKAIQSVIHLDSTVHRHWLAIKCELDRAAPACPSVTPIWPGADWHEREAFDMFGIRYEGHPNLRRILCAEDWEGYPLRKDYVQPDEFHGIANDFKQKDKIERKFPAPIHESKA